MNAREHFLSACLGLALPAITAMGPPATAAGAGAEANEPARTATAVIAVDDHWLQAEESGDTAWLDAMLLPEYRSISADGKPADKQKILAGAARNRGSDKMRKQVDAWLKTHPTRKSVVMQGDVAILSFSDPQTEHVMSSDVFVYRDGGWHAIYSQHSKAAE